MADDASLDQLVTDAEAAFAAAGDPASLENAKARWLGKSGALTERMKTLGRLDADARRAAGAQINAAKDRIEAALQARRDALSQAALDARLREEALDVTLPGRTRGRSRPTGSTSRR